MNFLKKFFLFFLLLIAVVMLVPVSVIRIEFGDNACYYFLGSNSTLEISYTHSVSLTKVVDIYRISNDGIFAVEERWQEFLAGQPLDFNYRAGSFYVKKMNKFLGKNWEYWFIPINNATIKINDKIVFVQPKEDGIMKIEIGRIPILLIISRRC
ncbi:conserved exported hypothetical protein [Thermococcus barophilus]|uniref:DUF1850 domain-containing protein n=1 Tax=Thermococcus barophilus TaxID=55802 RepID=A0A0S1X8X3_THEBA|nr:conserved exported hypothetical protein [Thermococcus barophilus]